MALVGQIYHLHRPPPGRVSELEIGGVDFVHHAGLRRLWLSIVSNRARRGLLKRGVWCRHVRVYPHHIRHGHVRCFEHRGDVIEGLLYLSCIVRRFCFGDWIDAIQGRHIQHIPNLEPGGVDMGTLRPSFWPDHLARLAFIRGNTVDLNMFPMGEAADYEDCPGRRMRSNRLPVNLIQGSQVLLIRHIDVHPGDIAKVHPGCAQHALEFF